MDINKTVTLKYYDTNGHNFGVVDDIPELGKTKRIIVILPQQDKSCVLKAVAAYKKAYRKTLRSPEIDCWLRANATVGQEFTANLAVSDNGEVHTYSSIKKK